MSPALATLFRMDLTLLIGLGAGVLLGAVIGFLAGRARRGTQAVDADPAVLEARHAQLMAELRSELGAQLAAAQGQLNAGLGRLLAVAEAYPDLKANQNMMQLTEELTSTENKVAFARQAFNDSVMAYNNKREVFPNSIFAGMFNFAPATLLEIPAEQQAEVRAAPKVQF